nr:putative ribonuclease H-like domain-containing protein [Tanacetum cinerariifolium]
MGLWYLKDSRFELIAYLDADHAGCKDDYKSTSGGLQFQGGKLVSLSLKKQDCTAKSTAEAEYVFLSALIIMAQQQHVADVHPDDLCPPNKRYDLMDANKKIDFEHVFFLCNMDLYGTKTNIFNLGRYKDKVGMKIPAWMILEAMKHTEHYRMYAEVFGIDVPLTQSQPTESTQGTYRRPSAPRSPNPKMDAVELSAPKRSTMIRFCIPQRRSTRCTPPTPVPTVDKANEMILQDTLQISLAEHKRQENVIDDSSISRNDEHNIPGTRLEPRSDKESLEVEFNDVVILVNVNEEEEEIINEVYKLKRREKGKIVEESRNTPFPTPIRSPRIYTDLVSLDTEKLQEMMGRYGYLFEHLRARFMPRKSFSTLADHLQEVLVDSLPTMVKKHVKEQVQKQVPEQQQDIAIWLALQMKFGILQVPQTTCRTSVIHPRDQDDPHDDAHPEGENNAKRQNTSEYEAYAFGESLSGQDNEKELGPSTSGNQVQVDDYDFWTESYASDDDEIPIKQVLQDIMEEVSLTIDEVKLKKIADEMLRQRCTSGDEHQYHIDQMKNFLKSDIRDPEAPALSLINQDLLYLKKRSLRPEKIVLSLYKFLAVIFNDDDIKERTLRWKTYVNGRPLGPQKERPE